MSRSERSEPFSHEESEAIADESRRAQPLDRQLADRLAHPAGAASVAISGEFVRGLSRSRLLPRRERELVAAARAGDDDARAQLVEAYLPLIGSVARNYRASSQVTHNELIQEGVVGVLRALERYDPELGVPFWAYAVWWVRQAMQQLIAELTRPVVMSDRALRQLANVKDVYGNYEREAGRRPTLAELGDRTGLEQGQLANLIAADRPPKPLEEPVEGEEGAVGMFGELISDPLAEDAYERVIAQVAAAELRGLLSGLSDRERAVLTARYGLDGEPASLREIAGRLGVSAERVRQLEQRALGKLRVSAGASQPNDG